MGHKKNNKDNNTDPGFFVFLFYFCGTWRVRNKRVNGRSIIKYASQRDIGYSRTQVATLCYPLNSFS